MPSPTDIEKDQVPPDRARDPDDYIKDGPKHVRKTWLPPGISIADAEDPGTNEAEPPPANDAERKDDERLHRD